MQVGIYLGPSGHGSEVGGAEASVATLAEVLREGHRVEIVHHRGALDLERLARVAGVNLDGVLARRIPHQEPPAVTSRMPWVRYRQARAWHAELSAPYDLFVAVVHDVPPFCHAPRGALWVLFPFGERAGLSPAGPGRGTPASLKHRLRWSYYDWEWRRRFAGYQVRLANSEFTRDWTRRRWGVECDVVYPPASLDVPVGEKLPCVLSVGRFATFGHSKRQVEMVTTFREMVEAGLLSDWEYFCVGGLAESVEDHAYFEAARRAAGGCPARVLANVEREELRRLLGRAKIFWHAAGLGEDLDARPQRAEHFGIATVEAMAAGCVPVVIATGGQREIVEHAVSGFLCDTLDELKACTRRLAADDALRNGMAAAARRRARRFGREAFAAGMRAALGRLLA